MSACVRRQADKTKENCSACREYAGRPHLVEANQTDERKEREEFGIRRQAGVQTESSTRRCTPKGGIFSRRIESFGDRQGGTDDRELAATRGRHSMGLRK